MNARILVAEDDPAIRTGLTDTLESEGYGVLAVPDGKSALAAWRQGGWDLLVLDIMMPEVSGYDVCREVRKKDPKVGVIMLTAKGEEVDKVVGLRLGADDYVTKPFGVHELLARIQAVLRRRRAATLPDADPEALPDTFAFGPATVHRRQFEVEDARGDRHPLTAREMALLEMLARHPDEVLTRERLLNEVWGVSYYGTTRTLDQHIAQLRKKVEPDPRTPATILTVHGIGYRYQPGDE